LTAATAEPDHDDMGVVSPLPRTGQVVRDATRAGRTLRVSWHGDRSVVVLSIWEQGTCTATFHVAAADVAAVTSALLEGPLAAPGDVPSGDEH
jgi:hypothetical protein